ncbi:LysR substrate-binding domain-containing protein [Ilumatobacter nonamiensis]|uniref:LysR substrate-binding domain-containing protein n=1 Tax=Ilumatobacter nonamiensis TaxID=467093 RepID=UPI000344B8CA|nr:LysR substrate-binding domain-containing protein [Ilumatobacter nonamiensis]
MNLRDLEYVAAVADHRHFGRAAEACGVSQPTLSAQIRKLEDDLGVELFERTPRNITLTAAGERVLERIRVVINEANGIADIAAEMADPESATLRVGLFPTLAPYLLPHVVPEVRSTFPDLELRLVEAKTDDIVDQLRSGRLDVGVLALPITGEDFASTELFTEEFVLATPAGHRLATSGTPVTPHDLADEQVMLLEDGHCLRDQSLAVCSLAGAVEDTELRSTSLETMRQMVAAGVGITLLPRLAVSPPIAPSPMISMVEFAEPRPSRTIAMFWRSTSAHRAFLPRLAEVFARIPSDLGPPR